MADFQKPFLKTASRINDIIVNAFS